MGATSPTYSTTATASAEYRAVFTNSNGTATTSAAFVTVSAAPSDRIISSDPTVAFPQYNLQSPNGLGFSQVIPLGNGNVVGVAGDVYLFDELTRSSVTSTWARQ